MLLNTRPYCKGGSASASGGMNLWQSWECDSLLHGSSVLVCAKGAALIALGQVRSASLCRFLRKMAHLQASTRF